jgi:hypothetical protein
MVDFRMDLQPFINGHITNTLRMSATFVINLAVTLKSFDHHTIPTNSDCTTLIDVPYQSNRIVLHHSMYYIDILYCIVGWVDFGLFLHFQQKYP